jgi:hypothetical protein
MKFTTERLYADPGSAAAKAVLRDETRHGREGSRFVP